MPERDEAYMRERVIRYFQDVKHETSSKYAKYLAQLDIVRNNFSTFTPNYVGIACPLTHLTSTSLYDIEEFGEKKIDGHIAARSFTTSMGIFTLFIMMEDEDALLPRTNIIVAEDSKTDKLLTELISIEPESLGAWFVTVTSLRLCTQCHQKKMQFYKCSACRNDGCYHVRYCSKACQRAHWPIHKKSCLSRNPISARGPYVPLVYHVLKD